MAVTGLTRNQLIGFKPVRGFESLRLRYIVKESAISADSFLENKET